MKVILQCVVKDMVCQRCIRGRRYVCSDTPNSFFSSSEISRLKYVVVRPSAVFLYPRMVVSPPSLVLLVLDFSSFDAVFARGERMSLSEYWIFMFLTFFALEPKSTHTLTTTPSNNKVAVAYKAIVFCDSSIPSVTWFHVFFTSLIHWKSFQSCFTSFIVLIFAGMIDRHWRELPTDKCTEYIEEKAEETHLHRLLYTCNKQRQRFQPLLSLFWEGCIYSFLMVYEVVVMIDVSMSVVWMWFSRVLVDFLNFCLS